MLNKLLNWLRVRLGSGEMADMRAFYAKFGVAMKVDLARPPTWSRLKWRAGAMAEELQEFNDALAHGSTAGMADALVDLVYFAKGTAIELHLPWEELWADVHRANMAKVVGTTKRGGPDVTKPDGWMGPKTLEIIEQHRQRKTYGRKI